VGSRGDIVNGEFVAQVTLNEAERRRHAGDMLQRLSPPGKDGR
jgi:hypothetical protein